MSTDILQALIDKLMRFIFRFEETILADETIYDNNKEWIKGYIESFEVNDELPDIIMKLLQNISDNA